MNERTIIAFLIVLFLIGMSGLAFAHDPFSQAINQEFSGCCSGKDCALYDGPPPVKVRGGVIFGDTFFRDAQRIRPETLMPEVRGQILWCRGKDGSPRCWHWPTLG